MRSIVLPVLLLGFAAVASCNTYYIVDAKHGRSIVAGDHYDGHIYHQDPRDRSNAKWLLEPVHGQPGFFFIRDTRHFKYIVAGDNYDGRQMQSGISCPTETSMVVKHLRFSIKSTTELLRLEIMLTIICITNILISDPMLAGL